MIDTLEQNRAPAAGSVQAKVCPPTNVVASAKGRFSWSVVNLALDLLLFATFVVLCWLAALTQFVFPSGATGGEWRLLGGTVEAWRSLQFGVLCGFAGEVLVHIMLHWSWVCGVVESRFLPRAAGKKTASDDGGRTLVGVISLAATLLLMGIGLGVAAYLMTRVD